MWPTLDIVHQGRQMSRALSLVIVLLLGIGYQLCVLDTACAAAATNSLGSEIDESEPRLVIVAARPSSAMPASRCPVILYALREETSTAQSLVGLTTSPRSPPPTLAPAV
jgi:hypothetical protein